MAAAATRAAWRSAAAVVVAAVVLALHAAAITAHARTLPAAGGGADASTLGEPLQPAVDALAGNVDAGRDSRSTGSLSAESIGKPRDGGVPAGAGEPYLRWLAGDAPLPPAATPAQHPGRTGHAVGGSSGSKSAAAQQAAQQPSVSRHRRLLSTKEVGTR